MSSIDLDGWTPKPFDLDLECARAREHLHRSIGQRARWAKWAIAEAVEREKRVMAGGWVPRRTIQIRLPIPYTRTLL